MILFKSLANLALYKIERNFIYDLYRELSRRLYVDYRNRGLGFIKSSNSAVLARNVNVVCLTFVTGVLMPVAAHGQRSGALRPAIRVAGDLQSARSAADARDLRTFRSALLLPGTATPNRYGEEENRAQRRQVAHP